MTDAEIEAWIRAAALEIHEALKPVLAADRDYEARLLPILRRLIWRIQNDLRG